MSTALELDKMTVEEKLRAMEMLWDDLRRTEAGVPVPAWHQELLDERERLVREGRAQFHDWATARERILRAVS